MKIEEIRERLHKIPELGFLEYKTKEFIIRYAKHLKCRVIEFAETGVILSFNDKKKNTICFRAEEDALEIKEKNDVPYVSIHENNMHACGHDGHMAILLKLGDFINSNLSKIKYNVLLIFQPSEEKYGGSKSLIESKVLMQRNIVAFFGMHIWPNLEKGVIYSSYDAFLAKAIEIDISIFEESVHIGDNNENKIFNVLSELLYELKGLDKNLPFSHRIGLGRISGGSARNVTPNRIEINGSIRVFDELNGKEIINRMKSIISNLALKYNVLIDFNYNDDFYLVKNDRYLVEKVKDEIVINDFHFFQSEDFGFYTKYYKCLFLLLGGGDIPSLHTDTFDFDMNILNIGLEFYKKLVFKKY